jgi:hypothetical protein
VRECCWDESKAVIHVKEKGGAMKHKKLLFVIAAVLGALCLAAAAQETVTVVPMSISS